MAGARAWLRSARQEPLLRNASFVGGGTTLGHALVFLALPALTRLYSPRLLGAFGVYTSVLSILLAVAMLGMEQVVPLPKSERQARAVIKLAVSALMGTSLLTLVAVILWRRDLAGILHNDTLSDGLLFLPFSLLAAGLYIVLSQWATRIGEFKRMGITRFTQRAVQVSVQVAGGALIGGPIPLFLGDALGRSIGTGSLIKTLPRAEHRVRAREAVSALRRYSRFSYLYVPATLSDVSARQLPLLMMSSLYGARQAGFYAVMQPAIGIPITLIGQAIAQAYLHEIAKLASHNPASLPLALRRATIRLAQIGIPVVALLTLPAPFLFPLILGSTWRTVGIFTALLFPLVACQFVVAPLTSTLSVLERQGILLLGYSAQLAIALLAFFGSASAGYSPKVAVGILSVGEAIAYVAIGLAIRTAAKRLADGKRAIEGQLPSARIGYKTFAEDG
jgi:O-antigen/teichoic acid export membrane protein